jgi:hypothetical protein
MLAILFAGQDIQSSTMFDKFDSLEVKKFLEYSSELIDQDVSELLNLSESDLNQSKNAQLLVTIYSSFVLSQWKKLNGPKFDYSAGYGVGEYVASFSTGAFSYLELLKIVQTTEEHLEYDSEYLVEIDKSWINVLTDLCKKGVTDFVIVCPEKTSFYNTIQNTFPDLNRWHISDTKTLGNAIYELNEKNTNHLA